MRPLFYDEVPDTEAVVTSSVCVASPCSGTVSGVVGVCGSVSGTVDVGGVGVSSGVVEVAGGVVSG